MAEALPIEPVHPPADGPWFEIRLHGAALALFGFAAAYFTANLAWFGANTAPPMWDQSAYLVISERLFQHLQAHDWSGGWQIFLNAIFNAKAPLLVVLPLPAFAIIGPGDGAVAVTLASLGAALCLANYLLLRELAASRWTALAGAVATATIPLIYGLDRQFLMEHALTVLVVVWLWLQLKSDGFRRLAWNCLLGTVLGLGLLMKVSFPVYIAGPFLLGCGRAMREARRRGELGRLALQLGLIAAIGAGLCLPWYLHNFNSVFGYTFSAGFGSISRDYSLGDPYALGTLLAYWKDCLNEGISVLDGAAILGVSLAWLLGRSPRSEKLRTGPTGLALSWSWFLIPFVLYSLGANKDIRFLAPALPGLSAAVVLMGERAFAARKWGRWLSAGVLAAATAQFVYIALPFQGASAWKIGKWILAGPEIGYAYRPVQERWPDAEIIHLIDADARRQFPGGTAVTAVLIADAARFNQHTFNYLSATQNSRIAWSALLTRNEAEWTDHRDWVRQFNYLVAKTGPQGPAFTCFANEQVDDLLQRGQLPYAPLFRLDLPDGSECTIYRRR